MEHRSQGRLAEFRHGWRVVLGAGLGSGLGVAGLLTYNSGLFVPSLATEIGLTRSAFGLVFFATTVAMAIALPVIGTWIDRGGARLPAIVGASLLAAGFAGLGLLTTSVAVYGGLMVAIGALSIGSSPVSYTRVVSGAFSAARGLALGLTQMGIGLAAAVVPPIVSASIERHGWRAGFFVLAAFALAGIVPALLIGRGNARERRAAIDPAAFRAVSRSSLFRRQMVAFVVMALGFAGLLPHFVPLLRDAGLSPMTAAGYAAMIGVSVIVSRLVIGALVDIAHAPWIAAAACGVAAIGCMLLAIGGAGMAPVAACALGCAMGAEADLVGFMTARHFGVAVYGRAYARQYAAFMLAAGAGPAWIGLAHDWSGSYRLPLLIATGVMVLAAGLFLTLPRMPHAR